MSAAVFAILLPLLAAPVLAWQQRAGARVHLAITLVTFALTWLAAASRGSGAAPVERVGAVFGVLVGFVAALFALVELGASQPEDAWRRRARLGGGQAMLGLALMGFYAVNAVLLWLAAAGLGLAAALVVALEARPPALGAAWAVMRLASAAALLALFGTLLLDQPVRPAPALGFMLLAFGYGLAAVVGWLPALLGVASPLGGLSGSLLPNLALLALLRFRHLAGTEAGVALLPGLGLAALLLAALAVRRRPLARLLGLTGIAQAGVVAVAFGLGGAAAVFGGLATMLLQTLAQAGAWQGLVRPGAAVGKPAAWLAGASTFVLTGLPPGGLFVGQYLIVSDVARQGTFLLLLLLLGWLPVALALLRASGQMTAPRTPGGSVLAAGLIALPLLLTVWLGFAMPAALVGWLSAAAVALR